MANQNNLQVTTETRKLVVTQNGEQVRLVAQTSPQVVLKAVVAQGPRGPAGEGGELDPDFVIDGGNF